MRTKNSQRRFPEVIPNISANQSAAIEAERSSSDLGLEIIIILIINYSQLTVGIWDCTQGFRHVFFSLKQHYV